VTPNELIFTQIGAFEELSCVNVTEGK